MGGGSRCIDGGGREQVHAQGKGAGAPMGRGQAHPRVGETQVHPRGRGEAGAHAQRKSARWRGRACSL